MKLIAALLFGTLISFAVNASYEDAETDSFGVLYFNAWIATQSPDAKAQDIEHYLKLLTDDVGHQHLPYDPDADRHPDGKANIRKGMTYYLGAHTEYGSTLIQQMSGHNVVVIKYKSYLKGIHPQTGQTIEKESETLEVLELENGKVSVIRKYSR